MGTAPPKCLAGGALSAAEPGQRHRTCLRASWHKQHALVATRTSWQRCGCMAGCVSLRGTCMFTPSSLACRALLRDCGLLGGCGLWALVASATWASLPLHGVSHPLGKPSVTLLPRSLQVRETGEGQQYYFGGSSVTLPMVASPRTGSFWAGMGLCLPRSLQPDLSQDRAPPGRARPCAGSPQGISFPKSSVAAGALNHELEKAISSSTTCLRPCPCCGAGHSRSHRTHRCKGGEHSWGSTTQS